MEFGKKYFVSTRVVKLSSGMQNYEELHLELFGTKGEKDWIHMKKQS